MPTNEERREIAARLREVKKTGFDFTWCKICMGVCGPECPVGCDEDEMAVDVAKRLADLVEPRSCRKVPGKMKYGRRMPACSECGYSLGDKRWNFCPKCGCEVACDAD